MNESKAAEIPQSMYKMSLIHVSYVHYRVGQSIYKYMYDALSGGKISSNNASECIEWDFGLSLTLKRVIMSNERTMREFYMKMQLCGLDERTLSNAKHK